MPDLAPAEALRAAAKLMRERAETATPGPWYGRFVPAIGGLHPRPDRFLVASGSMNVADGGFESDARHIASWHPAVALAVADWLDAAAVTAAELEAQGAYLHPDSHAARVARAYLGESGA